MEFDFTEEQLAVRDMAGELFERESGVERLRAVWAEEGPRDPKVWRRMAEVGLLGLGIPEGHGGSGGDLTDLALVLEEAGRIALPEPVVETLAVGAWLIGEAGTPEQRETWLPRIAAGEALVAVRLGGEPFVLDGDVASVLLVEDPERGELHAVPAGRFVSKRVASVDRARRLFEVTDVEASPVTRMAGGAPLAHRAFLRGAAATASVLNGVSSALLDMTIAHVSSREQFGRPVGSFQAVKHVLASMRVLTDSSRSAAWYAAYAVARDLPDAASAASVAKAHASEAAAFCNAGALQCHGGIGFTWEHPLHLWLKRGKALEGAFGTARWHRARLAEELFADA